MMCPVRCCQQHPATIVCFTVPPSTPAWPGPPRHLGRLQPDRLVCAASQGPAGLSHRRSGWHCCYYWRCCQHRPCPICWHSRCAAAAGHKQQAMGTVAQWFRGEGVLCRGMGTQQSALICCVGCACSRTAATAGGGGSPVQREPHSHPGLPSSRQQVCRYRCSST